MRRLRAFVVAVGSLVLAVSASAGAQDVTSTQMAAGIATLTAASRQQAVECGNAGVSCAITPYDICPEQSERFSVRLITPFSRVATAALEARVNNQPLGRMGPGAVNGWGIALAVSPAAGSPAADGIVRVELRRDDTIVIQPKWTIVGPITTVISTGVTRQLSRGFFVFPVDAFAPTSDVQVVLIGQSGETTCTLDRQQLSHLH